MAVIIDGGGQMSDFYRLQKRREDNRKREQERQRKEKEEIKLAEEEFYKKIPEIFDNLFSIEKIRNIIYIQSQGVSCSFASDSVVIIEQGSDLGIQITINDNKNCYFPYPIGELRKKSRLLSERYLEVFHENFYKVLKQGEHYIENY